MRAILLAMIVLLMPTVTLATQSVTVGVSDFPPCVIVEGGKVTGFDVDVVTEVCRKMDVEPKFVPIDDFGKLMKGVSSGKFDMAISGISITADRERDLNFSQPYLDSGLRMLVPAEGQFHKRVEQGWMLTKKIFASVRWLLLVALLFAHIVWFLEKGDDCFNTFYPLGILEAIYWAVVTMSTVGYGDFTPKHPVGRIGTTAIIVIGVGIFGFILANITAIVTNPGDFGALNTPQEMSGKHVAAVVDTTSVDAASKYGAVVVAAKTYGDAVSMLRRKEVEAVVFDSPSILATQKDNDKEFDLAGPVFDEQRYGIAMPLDSKIAHEVDQALLELMEPDRYGYLKDKWFGKEES